MVPQYDLNRFTRRAPGANPFVPLPRADEIDDLIEDADYSSFADRVEDFHDAVHGWVGGDMQDVNVAAFDPVFWAHHCMIDRIWYLWQIRHGNSTIPMALLELPLQPFNKMVRDVLDVQALGYEYAATANELSANGDPRA